MKNKFFIIAFSLLLCMSLFSCDTGSEESEYQPMQAQLMAINITQLPNKTVYSIGEESDWNGIIVEATYSDNSSKNITEYTVLGFDTKAATDNEIITISYTERNVTVSTYFTITVTEQKTQPEEPGTTEVTISSIVVKQNPVEKSFTTAEEINLDSLINAGMKISSVYSDSSEHDITADTSSLAIEKTDSVNGVVTVTIKYTNSNITKTVQFEIQLFAVLKSISAEAAGKFYVGDSFDNNINVTATYSNGTSKKVYGWEAYIGSDYAHITSTSITSITVVYKEYNEKTQSYDKASTDFTFTISKLGDDISSYNVGDIIFRDNTKISKEEASNITSEQKSRVAAIIGYVKEDGTALGVGLKQSDRCCWAKNLVNVPAIQFWAKDGALLGDSDGSDNYKTFVDAGGEPGDALNYAEEYAKKATGLFYSPFKTGWYLPTIKEFIDIDPNMDTLNDLLKTVGGDTIERYVPLYKNEKDDTGAPLLDYQYWTSNQAVVTQMYDNLDPGRAVYYYLRHNTTSFFIVRYTSEKTTHALVIRKFSTTQK